MPRIVSIKRTTGVAGQFALTANVQYPGEPVHPVTFVGSIHGAPGPIIMITPIDLAGTVVTAPARYGDKFDTDWVRNFFRN